MVSYRSGFVIPPHVYLISAVASATSLIKAAAALHHYAYRCAGRVPLPSCRIQ